MDLNSWHQYNKSFKSKCVYKVGADSGFFSEYNNMVLAIIYCMKHRIRFIPCSKWANFGIKYGWNDFFEPFCEEWNYFMDRSLYNERWEFTPQSGKQKVKYLWYNIRRRILKIDYKTCEILPLARRCQDINEFITIPELNLDYVKFVDVCREINTMIWRYNPYIRDEIFHRVHSILGNLEGKEYVSLHIRRGDKFGETAHSPIEKYINKLRENKNNISNIFVSTDDYSVFEELQEKYPQYFYTTMTKPEQRGYFQHEYEVRDASWRFNEMLDFFAAIEIMAESKLYIGTLSSNVGMYMYWRMPKGKCLGIDFDEWRIW